MPAMLLQLLLKSLRQCLYHWLLQPNRLSYMPLPECVLWPRVKLKTFILMPLGLLIILECYRNNEVSLPPMGIHLKMVPMSKMYQIPYFCQGLQLLLSFSDIPDLTPSMSKETTDISKYAALTETNKPLSCFEGVISQMTID